MHPNAYDVESGWKTDTFRIFIMVGHAGSRRGCRALPNALGGWASNSLTTKFPSSLFVVPSAETSIHLPRRPEASLRAIQKIRAIRGLPLPLPGSLQIPFGLDRLPPPVLKGCPSIVLNPSPTQNMLPSQMDIPADLVA